MKDIGAGSRQREQYLCLSSYSGAWLWGAQLAAVAGEWERGLGSAYPGLCWPS